MKNNKINSTKYLKIMGYLALILITILFYLFVKKQRQNNFPKIIYSKYIPNGYNAYTIPPFGIVISEKQKRNKELLKHEMIHWHQFQKEGLFNFLFNYFKMNIKYGYDLNPYEIEARVNESEYCKLNYTECIRQGKSNTVNNPTFKMHI